MIAAATPFFTWLLRASWQASILVVVLLVVQWMFQKKLSPRWRYTLWFLVLIRLALPAAPLSALSLFNYARLEKARVASETAAAPESQVGQTVVHRGPNIEEIALPQTDSKDAVSVSLLPHATLDASGSGTAGNSQSAPFAVGPAKEEIRDPKSSNFPDALELGARGARPSRCVMKFGGSIPEGSRGFYFLALIGFSSLESP